jgi:hypothetical protein
MFLPRTIAVYLPGGSCPHRALIEKYRPNRRIPGVNRSRFEKEVRLIPLTRNLPTGEKDSGCSKDLAPEHQTSAGA